MTDLAKWVNSYPPEYRSPGVGWIPNWSVRKPFGYGRRAIERIGPRSVIVSIVGGLRPEREVIVDAIVKFKGLAVHRVPVAPRKWVVTHMESGLTVGKSFRSASAAIGRMKKILPKRDWERPEHELSRPRFPRSQGKRNPAP